MWIDIPSHHVLEKLNSQLEDKDGNQLTVCLYIYICPLEGYAQDHTVMSLGPNEG